MLYVGSFGPACWISSYAGDGRVVNFLYQPLMRVWWRGYWPTPGDVLERYSRWSAKPSWSLGQRLGLRVYEWSEPRRYFHDEYDVVGNERRGPAPAR